MKTILRLVFRSLRQHFLSTVVTALSIALAGGLLMSVWVLKEESREVFTQMNSGFDAVLGARGSKLQLVLNAIFHLEASPGNIAAEDFEFIRKHPAVKLAIPLAVGDNLRGFRIAGTVPGLFDVEYAPGKSYRLASGRMFDAGGKEAVLGSVAAARLGLRVGDAFHPFHGLIFDEKNKHSETYVVTGILAPSSTPFDKVVWIPLHGVQTMSGHDPRASGDVSAVLVKLKTPAAGFLLDLMINRQGNRLTFAYPIGSIVAELFDKVGWFEQVLSLVAGLIVLVTACGVLVAIYNTMNGRTRDIAILRALGAHRRTIFASVVLEAAAIGALGMALAFAAYYVILSVVSYLVQDKTGVVLEVWAFNPVLLAAPVCVTLLCSVAGLFPAWKAYRSDVASNLAPLS